MLTGLPLLITRSPVCYSSITIGRAGRHELKGPEPLGFHDNSVNSVAAGESVPVTKTPIPDSEAAFSMKDHSRHVLFCGTHVIQTRAIDSEDVRAVVVRTGTAFFFFPFFPFFIFSLSFSSHFMSLFPCSHRSDVYPII